MSAPIPTRRNSVTVSPVPMSVPLVGSPPIAAQWGSAHSNSANPQSFSSRSRTSSTSVFPLQQQGKALVPFPLESAKIKILLLENVNEAAVKMLEAQDYEVTQHKSAMGEQEVIDKLKEGGYQAVGLRSKTKITARVIAECPSVSRKLFSTSWPICGGISKSTDQY